jgi:pyridoxal/pyridoxine/pyridoxamine kinase
LGYYLRNHDVAEALGKAANAVHAVLSETARRRRPEMALIRAQKHLSAPPQHFAVDRVF